MHKTVKDKYLLQLAVRKGLVKVVNKHIAASIDVNQSSEDRVNPLFIVALNGHIEVVQALLKNERIDLNKAMCDGETSLYIAAQKGYHEVVAALIAAGAVVHHSRTDGTTPL